MTTCDTTATIVIVSMAAAMIGLGMAWFYRMMWVRLCERIERGMALQIVPRERPVPPWDLDPNRVESTPQQDGPTSQPSAPAEGASGERGSA